MLAEVGFACRWWVSATRVCALSAVLGVSIPGFCLSNPVTDAMSEQRTIDDVMNQLGVEAQSRLMSRFDQQDLAYPPRNVLLVGLKREKRLELWVSSGVRWDHVHTYPVLAASGTAGPKLTEGDRQVPEGQYRVVALNPNSDFHLSMKLDYPNALDLEHAAREGRFEPGSDIFIHGKASSVGCLAIGDRAIEELFVLAAMIGIENIQVLLAPHDARQRPLFPVPTHLPAWTHQLYRTIEGALRELGRP